MEYHTHSDNPDQALKRFFDIGPAGFVMLVVLSFAVLLSLNSKAIWELLHGSETTINTSLKTVLSQRFVPISKIFDNPIFDRAGLLLFWALLGCIAYMVVWLLQYALISAREDYVEGHYVHPRSYTSQTYWRTVAAHRIFLLSALFVFGGYLLFLARAGLPVMVKFFYIGLYTLPAIEAFIIVVFSIILTSVCLYIGFMLWKLLRGAWGLVRVAE